MQSFAAEMDGPLAVRFTLAASAQACLIAPIIRHTSPPMASDCSHHQACLAAMDGRWFNERRLHASLYDGNRKRAPESTVDEARRMTLHRPPTPPPAPPEPHAPYRAPEPAVAASYRAPTGAAASASTGQPSDAAAAAMAAAEAAAPASSGGAQNGALITLPIDGYVKLRGLKGASERNGQVGVLKGY